jgi:amino acid adenylation domain-containing protein/non-ribosomal peptide synthase protein (TIGR01720 family)
MPATSTDPLPLTPLQQGMLAHWLQSPDTGADVEQMVCTLPEAVDAPRLRTAWQRALERHAALRVRFDWSGAEPCQFIAESVLLPWEERALTMEEVPAFLHADRFAPFDPAAAPLLRCTLLRIAENDFHLVWTFHHLLLDGRSIVSILHEVFAEYDGQPRSAATRAAALSEYLRWQSGADHSASLEFWKSHLRGVHGPSASVIEKLGDLSSAPAQEEADHLLSAETTLALQTLATETGVTLNTLVQAAWALLISRYTGEESVIFGATRACRHVPCQGAESLAGLLINTVPMATTVAGDQALRPWLQCLRQSWLDMRPHELTPLPLIRRAAGMPADQPLFNHLVVFEREDFTGALHRLLPGAKHRLFDLRELTTVPLTLQAYGGERLRLHCAFDTSRFDPAFIQRLLDHAAHLLTQFTQKPDAKLDEFILATPEECTALLAQDVRAFPGETTLQAWFTETAARFPDHIAVTGSHGSWTYRVLDQRSNAIAAALIAAGTQRGDIVALLMDRTGYLAAAILGILKAGAAYLPIDPAYPADRAAFMTADAGVKVLLTDTAMLAKASGGAFAIINCDTLPATALAPDISTHSAEDTAYIIFTSGSTGKPKGCMITHRNVVRLMRATEPWFGFHDRDVWTLFHSSAFDFSVWEIWGALLYGGRLAVVPWLTTRSPEDFCRLLCQEGVTVLNQTPSAFRQLIAAESLARGADPALPPFALRYVIFGGEALEMQSLRPWFERHGDQRPLLVNMYGITETTVHVTYRPLSASDLTNGSVIGEPIPDLQLHVLDPHTRQPAPIGIPGEMYVAGAGLARGYLNRPELTADRFPESWLPYTADTACRPYGEHPPRLYKTGDLARRLPNGDLEFLGRIDDQVKIRGFRIELGEIESVLCTHPAVREACVLVREDRPGDKRLCAWLVSGAPPSSAEVREHLRARLPDYMIPAAFVFMDAFPLTTNGKLDRRALPAPLMETDARAFTPPSTPNEHTLAAIWTKVLRIERTGIHDNFFELGGDSILSIQVITRAREAGLTLTPRQLFENPTVAALAALAVNKPAATPTAVPAEITGPFQPSPIQQWFLEQELEGGNHWNQTFLFTVSERLETAALEAALRAIVLHHSALRQRFVRRHNTWEVSIHEGADDDMLTLHDLSTYENGRLIRQIERACKVEQARLSFEFGPLLRAAYIDCGEDRPGRLLITVHHLAVDGVSWRILLEDVEKAYRQAAAGKTAALPPATAPFSAWAGAVRSWAATGAANADRAFWRDMLTRCESAATLRSEGEDGYGSNTEGETTTLRTRLSVAETEALLQRVPAAWQTRINDALLAALVHSVHQVHPVPGGLAIHLEGHGREAHIGGDLDVSRTVGWFTTIFPVCLMPHDDPAARVRAVQQQLAAIPGHGSGFSALGLKHEAAILFNYLGRMDSVTDRSELFSYASESTGPWHCQTAERKYQIEINAQVIGGELEVAWTAGTQLHSAVMIQQLADGFQTALQEIIAASGNSATVAHTALSGLDDENIARLSKGQTGIVEISALSPMQQLFYSASLTRPNAGYDQWSCQLRGPLDADKLRAAWSAVLSRHSILRSSFHSAGLPHPVQIVREGVEPEWTIMDASGSDVEQTIARILTDDAGQRNDLTRPMLSRFTLVRFSADHHFLLWSLPDLHLDGWSWPIVFSEVNALYSGRGILPEVPPYRTWLEWLSRVPEETSRTFWKQKLSGYTTPTALPGDLTPGPKASRRTVKASVKFDGVPLVAAARSLALSPGALVQAAWALLLAHAAAQDEVVFGTAFSGRPASLPEADRIVGPFVNNLPVRLRISRESTAAMLLQLLQGELFDLSEYQNTPVTVIQDCTEVPWKSRLFNSLAVFQNYAVPDAAKHFGDARISGFNGPIHTAYPLTLVVTPGDEWDATLIFQESVCSSSRAEAILEDFRALLFALATDAAATCGAIMSKCRLASGSGVSAISAPMRRPGGAAPGTRMERTLATLWQRAFGIEDITTEDNFFDLGGGSLLMVRLHAAISQELQRDVPLVDLFRFPTIASLARHLDPAATTATSAVRVVDQTQSRAAAARAAASRVRDLRTR